MLYGSNNVFSQRTILLFIKTVGGVICGIYAQPPKMRVNGYFQAETSKRKTELFPKL